MGVEPCPEHLQAAQQLLVAAQPVPVEPLVLLVAAASQRAVQPDSPAVLLLAAARASARPALPVRQSRVQVQVQCEVARAVFELEQPKREERSRYNCRRSTT
jgi:hypothetical protein